MLEILAPAGNLQCAKTAIASGANAIYLGLQAFSARQSAENFDEVALKALLEEAHFCGVKVYVAMNTVVKTDELDGFLSSVVAAWNMGVDAIILQDIFLGKWLHTHYPDMVLHLSTQAGVCTEDGAKLAKEYGFSRVILARETPISEIRKIAQIIETETFVQGALCTAFSGQCYFSSFVGGNSGNRGRCKQPCRKQYAYNRNGNTEKTYALSLSDLCVGEKIEKLIAAGVVSFKIEGRMRRAEYVGAAVKYYRQLLDKRTATPQTLSDLKRAYNRGNYTQGLAFGQDQRLLSTAIQGHIGEKIGVVKVINGKFLVESAFKPQVGDAFKILRGGVEIGGATYLKSEGKSFVLNSKIRLKNGDGVFITTDTAANGRAIAGIKRGRVALSLYFKEGELPKVTCGELIFRGDTPLQSAQNRPLSQEELRVCFEKTDGLSIDVSFQEIILEGKIFIPKSALNEFRRNFYANLCERARIGERKTYQSVLPQYSPICGKNDKTAVIATDFTDIQADIAIYKADDMTASLPENFLKGDFEKFLYYSPFLTENDLSAMEDQLPYVDGIYAENYSGIVFAKKHGLKIFAGTGFHINNPLSLDELLKENVAYYALSKEANLEEMGGLIGERAFVFSLGDIKLMDLCYCPFGKTCNVCDKRGIYELTDENNRVFPVRRYLSADGSCRFEVYNCATLIGIGAKTAGKLIDLSIGENGKELLNAKEDETRQKETCKQYTSGHYKRGVL